MVKTVPARTASRASSSGQALDDELPDAFDAQKPGVALVGVEDLRRRPPSGPCRHGSPALPDPEQELLRESVVAATAVQPIRDLALARSIGFDVTVEQQQRYPTHLGPPDLRVQGPAVESGTVTSSGPRRRPGSGVRGSPCGSRGG